MRTTAVVSGRNDNYGGHFLESAVYSLNSMLRSFDEVIYVDWNTEDGKKTVTAELESKLVNLDRLRTIQVTPEQVKTIMGDGPAQPMCEVMARNIGIRRATGDIVVSTNLDVIVPSREQLELAFKDLKSGMMVTIAKHDVELADLQRVFKDNVSDVQSRMPLVFGLWPIEKRLMSPYLTMTKDLMSKHQVQSHHQLASLICACGDFQAATRDTWHDIRGFEESQRKRLFGDTQVQYKVIQGGGIVFATNFPPLYHIEHARDNSQVVRNSEHLEPVTTNDSNWGLREIISI
jgi:hypothetical protein